MDVVPPENEASPPVPSGTSLLSRLTNVFVAPGEVFDEIKLAPPALANWVVPLMLAIVVGIAVAFVLFSQPAIVQNIKNAADQQETVIRKRVTDGKINQQQADQQIAMVQMMTSPTLLKVEAVVGTVVVSVVYLFLLALVAWLIGRFALGGGPGYVKMLEVVGLSMMILVLQAIVNTSLAVIFSSPGVTIGPSLFISHFDPQNLSHRAMATFDLLTLWAIAVLAVGLSRVTSAAFFKSAAWLYGLWILYHGLGFGLAVVLLRVAAAAR